MIKKQLKQIILNALEKLSVDREEFALESTSDSSHGDYATNIAMFVSKVEKTNPRELAEKIKKEIDAQKNSLIAKIEVAGPGFLNITLSDKAITEELDYIKKMLPEGDLLEKKEKINIEFISANPTGELHIGHGRGAFYGDILANVLSYAGADVTREYYINDGRDSLQIKELGKLALGKGNQYKTEKTEEIIKNTDFSNMNEGEAGLKLTSLIQVGNKKFIENKLGISFDIWYSEEEQLHKTNATQNIKEKLAQYSYERDSAVWLKTSEFGDDEDRVLVRSNGTATYFLTDIAYHADKFGRKYNSIINVWGADHHGHVKRMMAVKKMLKWSGELDIFIAQLVSLKDDGETKKMSKRAGTVVYLESLVDELGIDVVRWFFVARSLNTHMEFDMELARQQSEKNPVYYVQYAHARICSIIRNAENKNKNTKQDIFQNISTRALAIKIIQFADIIENAVRTKQLHKLTTYAHELAGVFSSFYQNVRVIDEDVVNTDALKLSVLTKQTIAQTLSLLGISSPEKM